MLIEFSVTNYRSFKERVTFSLVAAKLKSTLESVDENNVFDALPDLQLLKSAVIYGANASGKSNLAKAAVFLQQFALNSSRESQSGDKIDAQPFLLSSATIEQPSEFEIVFLMDGEIYRYGFAVNSVEVVAEWLYHTPAKTERYLFEREKSEIRRNRGFREGRGMEEKTRHNALFLSVVAQFNGALSQRILDAIANLNIITAVTTRPYSAYTEKCLEQGYNRDEILAFMKAIDVGIEGLRVERKPLQAGDFPPDMPDALKSLIGLEGEISRVRTKHSVYSPEGEIVRVIEFDMEGHESAGTRKIFHLIGPLLDTLKTGKILFIDELDASLHTLLLRALVELFNSHETNPHNAQLVFTTHDTNLLSARYFRRDQIWLVEKDQQGVSDLFALAEMRIRNDSPFEKDYLQGRYGAIPYIGAMRVPVGASHA